MSDPRYRKGVFVGRFSRQEERARRTEQLLASPLTNGWQPIDLLADGRRVWQLEQYPNVTMHRLNQADRERFGINDEWLVYIDARPYAGYNGPVGAITADVLVTVTERQEVAA